MTPRTRNGCLAVAGVIGVSISLWVVFICVGLAVAKFLF